MSISVSSSGISTSSATAWLSKALQADGVSSSTAQTAAGDLLDAAETSLSANPDESDTDFRAALDKQIDQDVQSGKLSQDEADKVKKALDQMTSSPDGSDDGDAGGTDATSAVPGGKGVGGAQAAGGAGGGSGGSSNKTELSETVTISGNIKTTVITYSDGTTTTETATATKADHRKYDKTAVADETKGSRADATAPKASSAKASPSGDAQVAQDYLAQTPPGTLFSKAA